MKNQKERMKLVSTRAKVTKLRLLLLFLAISLAVLPRISNSFTRPSNVFNIADGDGAGLINALTTLGATGNIVVNGSFENGNFQNTLFNYDQLPVNSTDLTGWTVVQNAVAWGINPTDGFTASDGAAFVDLTGLGTESPYGGVRQTLNTMAGQQYLFSLDVSNSGAAETVTVNGSPIQLSAGPSFLRGSTTWTTQTGSFVADGPQTVLDIVGTGGLGSFIIFVDNVSVTATQPPTPAPTLGIYPDTSLLLSGDTTVAPSVPPTNTTSMNVSTSTNFKGKLEADPNTGNLRVTDPHPAGTYTVTVTAFNGSNGPTTTNAFTLTVTTPATCNPVSFAAAANFGVDSRPSQVVVGDFNGDGKQDLAVADSSNVSIWLGNGAGGFSAGTQLNTTGSLALGDFNGDGNQDLAIAYSINPPIFSGKVSIFLGNGAGNFTVGGTFDTDRFPFSVAVGDFNGDGKQDLAVACDAADDVSILLGDGAGNFSAATNFGVSSGPQSVAVGDFNGDGKPDLAVACIDGDKVSILLGNGAGSFGPAISFNPGGSPRDVVVGDFNGDGKQDLAVSNPFASTASVLLGDGMGSFGGATSFGVGSAPYSIIAVGDFNNDGKLDLAVPNVLSADVSILLGDGVGGFSSAINFSVDLAPFSVAVGDFNGDGKQDLATTNLDANNVSILLRDCAPTQAQINNVITSINNSAQIPSGTKTSINAKLQAALAALQSGNIATACIKLQDFLNEVSAQREKKIPAQLADALTNTVIQIRAELGCG
ncbi:MAG TPA: FG-GAP-like repeat-containing protein [Blastocatellia bacterium]|nr:FG-GAP-like repeat-containing protein [Blastocatellia bacterium]